MNWLYLAPPSQDAALSLPDFFGWFQIVCLAAFIIAVTSRAISVRVRQRVNPVSFRLRKGLQGLMEISLFVGVNLWSLAVLLYVLRPDFPAWSWLFGWRLCQGLAVRVAGSLLIAVAFGIFFLSLVALGDSWRLGIDRSKPGELVTHGIYARSRNPIYVFFDLYFLGTFLLNGPLFFLLFALLAAANLHYQVLQEERFLAQVHGLAYQSYRRRTARYFTWRWPAFLVGLRPGPGRRPACAGGSGEDLPRPGDSLPEEMEG